MLQSPPRTSGKLPAQQLLDPVGQPDGEPWDGGAVAHAGQRVELGAGGRRVGRGLDPASIDRAQAVNDPFPSQRLR